MYLLYCIACLSKRPCLSTMNIAFLHHSSLKKLEWPNFTHRSNFDGKLSNNWVSVLTWLPHQLHQRKQDETASSTEQWMDGCARCPRFDCAHCHCLSSSNRSVRDNYSDFVTSPIRGPIFHQISWEVREASLNRKHTCTIYRI